MHEKEIPVGLLKLKDNTRLMCIHGCMHYKQNPLCPPACPDAKWFERLIRSYNKVDIYHETVEFIDNIDFLKKKSFFNKELLKKIRDKKKNGSYYALSLISGACSYCEDENCKLDNCLRRLSGRFPVCATNIDIVHLATEILGLSETDILSFYKYNINRGYFNKDDNTYLCLGLIFS